VGASSSVHRWPIAIGNIQEIYAHLLVYYAIRVLINRGAEPIDLDPDRVSFIRSLRVARRQVTDQAALPPEHSLRMTQD
jgi:hypothetical protein